jgi:hypothetical protein
MKWVEKLKLFTVISIGDRQIKCQYFQGTVAQTTNFLWEKYCGWVQYSDLNVSKFLYPFGEDRSVVINVILYVHLLNISICTEFGICCDMYFKFTRFGCYQGT